MSIAHEEHKQRHRQLHCNLDELLADYIHQTGKLLSETTVLDLVRWSAQQMDNPTTKSF